MNNALTYTIQFPNTHHATVTVSPPLSTSLTLQNSPILFGCRTGICGTCLVLAKGNMHPPNPEEQEMLDLLAPAQPNARLACQIEPTGNLSLTSLAP